MAENPFFCGVYVGLKDFAILSDGPPYPNPKFYRTLEEKLE
jgi:putative transposase